MADEKILEEELLDDADLEGVAGGTLQETWDDRSRLQEMGAYKFNKEAGFAGSIADSFSKLGQNLGIDLKVTSTPNMSKETANQYFINGVEVSRNVAWEYINDVFSRYKK